MSEEELQLLITMDDPGELPEEDVFTHLHAKSNLEYWLSQRFPACYRLDLQGNAISNDEANKVTFGQGDWTCTLSKFSGAAKDIEVCTVTHSRDGEIVEQRVFYDFRGLQQ